MPRFEDYFREVAGDAVVDQYVAAKGWAGTPRPHGWSDLASAERRRLRATAPIWWANPTDATDRATAFLPALLYERLDEIGIDFTISYASVGGMLRNWPGPDLRVAGCRALNTYLAEQFRPFADRMTVAALIPAYTPGEVIAELDHAVKVLGSKVVVLPSYVERPIPAYADVHDRLGRQVEWLDLLALDSDHDYDPVWQRCVDLGVAVTTHSGSHGIGFRRSTSNFMFNHIGHFAAAGDAFAKAVFFGGVTNRFPTLNFAFLEQGAVSGVALFAALVERWEKRGGANIARFDPTRIDWPRFDEFVARYGSPALREGAAHRFLHHPADAHPAEQLNGVLSSDLSHWDVPDMLSVVKDAFRLVEQGLLSRDQFRAFSAENCIRLHGQMNPRFFDGTIVEEHARAVLSRT